MKPSIMEVKSRGKIYKLTDLQVSRVKSARNSLKNKETITNDELQREILQWFSLK